MNDPHVETLFYRLIVLCEDDFKGAPPLIRETDTFRLTLEDGLVTVELKEHFAEVSDANRVVERYLRAWELDDALSHGYPTIQFKFKNAEVIDRKPPPPGTPQVIQGSVTIAGSSTVSAKVSISRGQYPPPPNGFDSTDLVEVLWQRYLRSLAGGEPLPSMAYFCLDRTVKPAGGEEEAAKQYNISRHVLRKLKALTSWRGDDTNARKGDSKGPLTQSQADWIRAALLKIIRRVGERNPDLLPCITMGDLPSLKDR